MDVRQPWFVAGFLCGAIVASAAVLLSTPISGRGLRQAVIDHLKRAQDELADSRRRLQALFDNALDAVLLADDRGRYVDANPAACTLLGYTRDELLALGVADITPAPDIDAGRAAWAAFLRDGRQEGEYTVCRKDGTAAVVEFRAAATSGCSASAIRPDCT